MDRKLTSVVQIATKSQKVALQQLTNEMSKAIEEIILHNKELLLQFPNDMQDMIINAHLVIVCMNHIAFMDEEKQHLAKETLLEAASFMMDKCLKQVKAQLN